MKNRWQKVESPIPQNTKRQGHKTESPIPQNINRQRYKAESRTKTGAAETPAGKTAKAGKAQSPRYTRSGRRRGANPFAAPLGLLIVGLAAFGLVSLVFAGVKAIERARDDTALRQELYDFLLPVMRHNPEPFTDVNETRQDALLLAAIWRVTEAERVRLLRDESGVSSYPIDGLGRMLIPVSEIEDSYLHLFGSGVTIYHRSIGDEGMTFSIEYDGDEDYYHVPSTSASSMYVPVIDTIRKKGGAYTVRVGYVLYTKIGRDEKGELVDPTPDMAEKFQIYTVEKIRGGGWKLVSIADEKPAETGTTSAEDELAAEEFDEDYVEVELNDTTTTAATTTAKK